MKTKNSCYFERIIIIIIDWIFINFVYFFIHNKTVLPSSDNGHELNRNNINIFIQKMAIMSWSILMMMNFFIFICDFFIDFFFYVGIHSHTHTKVRDTMKIVVYHYRNDRKEKYCNIHEFNFTYYYKQMSCFGRTN